MILAIETSCDETAICIMSLDGKIISEKVFSQDHLKYNGVVPEISARMHVDVLHLIVRDVLQDSKISFQDLKCIIATGGPGLVGSILVGLVFAKTLAWSLKIPFIAVNHLEGHIFSGYIEDKPRFPFLALLVSGGHSQIVLVKDFGDYEVLGRTLDDSCGEAFDKVARMLGLGYPGGPVIERMARNGEAGRFKFKIPLVHDKEYRDGCDFSFSGIKSAVNRLVRSLEDISEKDKCDIAADFQFSIRELLCNRVKNAIEKSLKLDVKGMDLVVVGGVSANRYLLSGIKETCDERGVNLRFPKIHHCTDNGSMIANVGLMYFNKGKFSDLNFSPRPNWNYISVNS